MTTLAEPRPRLWTRAEYHRLAEIGLFHGQRTELIEGEIVVLSPQNWPHASTVDRVAEVLRTALGGGHWVRMLLPLNLGAVSEPEPDVSVVAGKRDDFTDHPSGALLVVEASDTTLAYDRGRKASLYARAGIADYWIVNLVNRRLEVYRDPAPDPSQPYGHAYRSVTTWTSGDAVAPLCAPRLSLAVADLLP